eukprot:Platyproteum_vivax@DN16085_c0_g1_i1.p1
MKILILKNSLLLWAILTLQGFNGVNCLTDKKNSNYVHGSVVGRKWDFVRNGGTSHGDNASFLTVKLELVEVTVTVQSNEYTFPITEENCTPNFDGKLHTSTCVVAGKGSGSGTSITATLEMENGGRRASSALAPEYVWVGTKLILPASLQHPTSKVQVRYLATRQFPTNFSTNLALNVNNLTKKTVNNTFRSSRFGVVLNSLTRWSLDNISTIDNGVGRPRVFMSASEKTTQEVAFWGVKGVVPNAVEVLQEFTGTGAEQTALSYVSMDKGLWRSGSISMTGALVGAILGGILGFIALIVVIAIICLLVKKKRGGIKTDATESPKTNKIKEAAVEKASKIKEAAAEKTNKMKTAAAEKTNKMKTAAAEKTN